MKRIEIILDQDGKLESVLIDGEQKYQKEERAVTELVVALSDAEASREPVRLVKHYF